MACDSIVRAFNEMSGQLSKEVFRRSIRRQPMTGLVMQNRGEFPLGVGYTLTNTTTTRNFPLTPVATRTALTTGTSDACLPPTLTTEHGVLTQTASINHLALNTPEFCADEIKFDWQFAKQTENVTKQLTDITAWVWTQWFKHDYVRIAGHHVSQQLAGATDIGVAGGAAGTNGYAGLAVPTATLSNGEMSSIYNDLYREGGEHPLANDMDDESPVFGVVLGKEQSDLLFRNDPNLLTSERYAWMGARDEAPFLPSGMPRKRRNFGGFMHYIDPYPRRFTATGAPGSEVYTEISPFVSSSSTKGTKQLQNPAYKTATYEEVIIYHPGVYRSLGVPGITSPSAGWKYDATEDMGNFSVRNIADKECNPDGNKLFFRAIFRDAAEPLSPELGYAMLVLRCDYFKGSAACPTS